jgi:hypothetical protein
LEDFVRENPFGMTQVPGFWGRSTKRPYTVDGSLVVVFTNPKLEWIIFS